MFAKILLICTGVIFGVYGIACAINPALPAGYIGVELGDAGGTVEFMAMYGGLQAAMGLLFLYFGLRTELHAAGLKCIVLLLGGLGVTRLVGLMVHGPDSYNLGAVVYELGSVALALWALSRSRSQLALAQ